MLTLDDLQETLYEVDDGLAWVTINRPERYNSFWARTVDELITCFKAAWADPSVGVVALTGAGDKAFCAGGDVKIELELGGPGTSVTGIPGTAVGVDFQHLIRTIPKPVIAAVNGVAVGGGHVFHVLCDITIAADTARFGQVGPKVGSWDAGLGTGILARVVGEKRAKEIWFMNELHSAQKMYEWGLVNAVVPADQLRAEVRRWADTLLQRSPTALQFLKHAFNADTEVYQGIGRVAFDALDLFIESEEGREGKEAFTEKRDADFSRFRQ